MSTRARQQRRTPATVDPPAAITPSSATPLPPPPERTRPKVRRKGSRLARVPRIANDFLAVGRATASRPPSSRRSQTLLLPPPPPPARLPPFIGASGKVRGCSICWHTPSLGYILRILMENRERDFFFPTDEGGRDSCRLSRKHERRASLLPCPRRAKNLRRRPRCRAESRVATPRSPIKKIIWPFRVHIARTGARAADASLCFDVGVDDVGAAERGYRSLLHHSSTL